MLETWIAIGVAVIAVLQLLQTAVIGAWMARGDRQTVELLAAHLKESADAGEIVGSRLETMQEEISPQLRRIQRYVKALAIGDGVNPVPPVTKQPQASGLDRKHHVVSLADRGIGTADISRQLNIPKGEAELVLGLKSFLSRNPKSAPLKVVTRDGQEVPVEEEISAGTPPEEEI